MIEDSVFKIFYFCAEAMERNVCRKDRLLYSRFKDYLNAIFLSANGDKDKLKEYFHIPEDYIIMFVPESIFDMLKSGYDKDPQKLTVLRYLLIDKYLHEVYAES
jgi:hypothetical protein